MHEWLTVPDAFERLEYDNNSAMYRIGSKHDLVVAINEHKANEAGENNRC